MPGQAPDDAYDAMAREYAADIESNAYNALYERPGLIGLLPPMAGRRVLEVGCGSGPLSAWLVEHGAEVVGFDASSEMVGLARERGLPNASFSIADLSEPLDFSATTTSTSPSPASCSTTCATGSDRCASCAA